MLMLQENQKVEFCLEILFGLGLMPSVRIFLLHIIVLLLVSTYTSLVR